MTHADRAREIVPRVGMPLGSLRRDIAAALAEVEREAMERCLEVLAFSKHVHPATEMRVVEAEIRAAFAADDRE